MPNIDEKSKEKFDISYEDYFLLYSIKQSGIKPLNKFIWNILICI